MKKRILANLLFYTGISYLLFRIRLLNTDIRAINYHCTPESFKPQFEKQLRFFNKYFDNINLTGLSDYFAHKGDGIRKGKKPGLIISFDDGLRSNFDFAIGILEKYNFTGWFFIPTGFILDPSIEFVNKNSISTKQFYPDNRYGLNLNEAQTLAEKHIIGCHTYTHHRMSVNDTPEKLEYEISHAKNRLEEILALKEISCFCWVGGEMNTYTSKAYTKIKTTGYRFSFATITQPLNKNSDPQMIHRSNIESEYSIPLVMFQLSGIMDFLYFRKRKQVKMALYNNTAI